MPSRGSFGSAELSLTILLLLGQMGCSTNYQPRSPNRLSVVIEGGGYAYARDGKTFSHGAFGSGLMDAVEDDPQALEAAETHHEHMVGGVIAYGAGLVCLIGGLTWALAAGDPNDEDKKLDSEQTAIAIGALGCWAAGLVTGSVLIAVGQPYQWDAINIYNDNREARSPRSLPPLPAPPSGIPPVPARPPAAPSQAPAPTQEPPAPETPSAPPTP
jgi:hypothetical protein